ncbi:MAG: type phosphodiesterase/nucleotide pyrophosphatase [Bryobacterales bacterium]|nr:type phosphodiesterase/nucleotide pyrophosphatase [Bryobacterales bacterium]
MTVEPVLPELVVAPNGGVVYTGGTKKIAEHGGFAYDDRNVLMLVSNLNFNPHVVNSMVETRQVAPTILKALGLDPRSLEAVQKEGTPVLPGLSLK